MPIQENRIAPMGQRLHFACTTAEYAAQDELCENSKVHFVEIGSSRDEGPMSLFIIQAFCNTLNDTIDAHEGEFIVICLEDLSPSTRNNARLLCGAHLILGENCSVDKVQEILTADGMSESSHIDIATSNQSIQNMEHCWRALERARSLQWIGPEADGEEAPSFDIEMAAHYVQPANGGIHVLIPGKLLLFPPPCQLAAGLDWADCPQQPGRPPSRHFSAAFLADVLEEFEVAAVASLGRTADSDASVFRARGMDVHDLQWDPARPALLAALDRLLAVSRAASAPVAVFCGGEGVVATGGRLGCVGTLAAAWLAADCGFDGGAAAAWVRMGMPAPGGGAE